MSYREIEILQARIAELEQVQEKQENIGQEKLKHQDYQIDLKEQSIQQLKDQQMIRQNEFRAQLHKLEEELELERENGIELDKVTN